MCLSASLPGFDFSTRSTAAQQADVIAGERKPCIEVSTVRSEECASPAQSRTHSLADEILLQTRKMRHSVPNHIVADHINAKRPCGINPLIRRSIHLRNACNAEHLVLIQLPIHTDVVP